MSTPQPTLDQLQRWMQSVVMHAGGVVAGSASAEAREAIAGSTADIDELITRSQSMTAIERLEIYNRSYFGRLLECLREEYSVLAATLGEDAFDSFALAYLHDHPPQSYTLADLGAGFPEFLAATRPAPETASDLDAGRIPNPSVSVTDGLEIRPTLVSAKVDSDGLQTNPTNPNPDWPDLLIDLARLEQAINVVFDGPGVEGQPLLKHDDLAAISPDRWPQAQVECVPCLKLLALRFPLNDFFTSTRRGEQPVLPARTATFIAVTRRNYRVYRKSLKPLEYQVLRALQEGETVLASVSRAAEQSTASDEELSIDVQQWFFDWCTEGYLLRVVL